MVALLGTSCGSSRQVTSSSTEVSGEGLEMRDSLREEVSLNLDENLTEHEVITETVICNDSVKVERVTDRVTVRERSARMEAKKEEVRVVRDTVCIERKDSVQVQDSRFMVSGPEKRGSALVQALKWVFWIIVSLTVFIIVFKVTRLFKF